MSWLAHSASQSLQMSVHRQQKRPAFSLCLAIAPAAVVQIAAQSRSSAMHRARVLDASSTHAAAQRLHAVAQALQSEMQRLKSKELGFVISAPWEAWKETGRFLFLPRQAARCGKRPLPGVVRAMGCGRDAAVKPLASQAGLVDTGLVSVDVALAPSVISVIQDTSSDP